jgi:hypothetical protein
LEVVRSFIEAHLVSVGTPPQALPTLAAIMQFPFDAALCPLIVLEPVATAANWLKYAVGDVTLTMNLSIHEIRLRSGALDGEEAAAIGVLCDLASAISADYRLGGNVQNASVESIAIAEPGTLHRLGIPVDELVIFAAATMKLQIIWTESCFATA